MAEQEFTVPCVSVLSLADISGCSAYDCEFVALAKQLSVKLMTEDKKILAKFSDVAVLLNDFK
jgi:predicted nucleic acid-binding protein